MFAKIYMKIVGDEAIITPKRTAINGVVVEEGKLEQLGRNFTLGIEEFTDDLLLLVGRVNSDPQSPYASQLDLTVRAIATFYDGTTQEESIVVR